MERKKRNDRILAGGLLALAAVFLAGARLARRDAGRIAQVDIDGQTVWELPLSRATELLLENKIGGVNRLVIRDKKASVTEASCPDQICVRQGGAGDSGQTIVCLPNRIVITIR